jgi:hypothetical protein
MSAVLLSPCSLISRCFNIHNRLLPHSLHFISYTYPVINRYVIKDVNHSNELKFVTFLELFTVFLQQSTYRVFPLINWQGSVNCSASVYNIICSKFKANETDFLILIHIRAAAIKETFC